jgi:hypothetical protein
MKQKEKMIKDLQDQLHSLKIQNDHLQRNKAVKLKDGIQPPHQVDLQELFLECAFAAVKHK